MIDFEKLTDKEFKEISTKFHKEKERRDKIAYRKALKAKADACKKQREWLKTIDNKELEKLIKKHNSIGCLGEGPGEEFHCNTCDNWGYGSGEEMFHKDGCLYIDTRNEKKRREIEYQKEKKQKAKARENLAKSFYDGSGI